MYTRNKPWRRLCKMFNPFFMSSKKFNFSAILKNWEANDSVLQTYGWIPIPVILNFHNMNTSIEPVAPSTHFLCPTVAKVKTLNLIWFNNLCIILHGTAIEWWTGNKNAASSIHVWVIFLCTYDLYGPVRNVFDAGRYITWASGRGWAMEMESFLGPVKWHRAERRVPFGAQKSTANCTPYGA